MLSSKSNGAAGVRANRLETARNRRIQNLPPAGGERGAVVQEVEPCSPAFSFLEKHQRGQLKWAQMARPAPRSLVPPPLFAV